MSDWREAAQNLALAVLGVAVAILAVLTLTRDYDVDTTATDPRDSRAGSPRDTTSEDPPQEPTSTGSPGGPATLEKAREVLLSQQPLDVLVLGDSSGDGPLEWPAEWGRALTDDRTVTIWQWNPEGEQFAAQPLRPPSTGDPFVIWNLSQPGVGATYGTQHLDAVRAKPDLVLLNYGHFNTRRDIGPQLDKLMAEVRERWRGVPTVLMLQNPTLDQRAAEQATIVVYLRDEWSPEHRIPTIDVNSAFRRAGTLEPLLGSIGTNPSRAGTDVWVREVIEELTPGAAEGGAG